MKQQSANYNQFKRKVSEYEKVEIQFGLSQLNRGERISLEEFLEKISKDNK